MKLLIHPDASRVKHQLKEDDFPAQENDRARLHLNAIMASFHEHIPTILLDAASWYGVYTMGKDFLSHVTKKVIIPYFELAALENRTFAFEVNVPINREMEMYLTLRLPSSMNPGLVSEALSAAQPLIDLSIALSNQVEDTSDSFHLRAQLGHGFYFSQKNKCWRRYLEGCHDKSFI